MKPIFATCTYAAQTAYDDRLERREERNAARQSARLAPLPPPHSPPRFELPSLSDLERSSSEEVQAQSEGLQYNYDSDPEVHQTLFQM